MNAGAYNGEVCSVISQAHVLTRAGELKTYNHRELNFRYRHSVVQDTGDIVLSVTFSMKFGDKPTIGPRWMNSMQDGQLNSHWSIHHVARCLNVPRIILLVR